MPEGHLLHRYAREQSHELAGSPLVVSSPQGRFDPSGLDGAVLRSVDAYGKHLLYRFEAPGHPSTVHVHLGMRGIFLRHPDPRTPPRPSVRMRLAGRVAYDLIAPTRCETLSAEGVDALLQGLGPDPLREDADAAEALRRLRAFGGPLGAALLDQSVWAGVGNAWRAELLYLARLDPGTRTAQLSEAQAANLWRRTVDLMTAGRDAGQVVSDPAAPDERWVYKRPECRGCGAPVRTWTLAGRDAYACTAEQLQMAF